MRLVELSSSFVIVMALVGCGEVVSALPDTAPGDGPEGDGPPADGPTGPVIAVGNFGSGSVTFHTIAASGDTAPLRVLSGAATLLANPRLATANGELFAANSGGVVTVHAASAEGDVAPIRQINGAATGLANLGHIAIHDGELFVLSTVSVAGIPPVPSIRVFSVTADGDVAPLRVISGAATGLNSPLGITVGNDEIFVANNASSTVTVYPVSGNGNIPPLRTLTGTITRPSSTELVGNELVVGDPSSIEVYASGAAGAVAPLRVVEGPTSGIGFSFDVCVHAGELITHHRNNNAVQIYPFSGNGDIAPIRTISGAATLLDSPQSCVVIP